MDIPTHCEVLAQIEAFLLRHNMAPTRFGREATGEPQLIDSMQKGRSPSLKVLERVAVFMKERDTAIEEASSSRKPGDLTAAQQSEAA